MPFIETTYSRLPFILPKQRVMETGESFTVFNRNIDSSNGVFSHCQVCLDADIYEDDILFTETIVTRKSEYPVVKFPRAIVQMLQGINLIPPNAVTESKPRHLVSQESGRNLEPIVHNGIVSKKMYHYIAPESNSPAPSEVAVNHVAEVVPR